MGTGEPLNLAIRKLHQCFHIPIKRIRKTSPVKKTHLNISLCRQSRTGVMRGMREVSWTSLTRLSGSATRHPFHNARVNKGK